MQIFCLYSKSYEESIFDTDNSKIIYFDNKFKSWFSALQILEKTLEIFKNFMFLWIFYYNNKKNATSEGLEPPTLWSEVTRAIHCAMRLP